MTNTNKKPQTKSKKSILVATSTAKSKASRIKSAATTSATKKKTATKAKKNTKPLSRINKSKRVVAKKVAKSGGVYDLNQSINHPVHPERIWPD